MLRMRRLLSERWPDILACGLIVLAVYFWKPILGFAVGVLAWGWIGCLVAMMIGFYVYVLLGPWILWIGKKKEWEEAEPLSVVETIAWSSVAIAGVIVLAYVYYAYGVFDLMEWLLKFLVEIITFGHWKS
jgi:hypothetical protein